MRSKLPTAMLIVLSVSQIGVASCSQGAPEAGVNTKVQEECKEFLEMVENPEMRSSLVDWADREVFSREFSPSDFKIGHFSGPGYASLTFDVRGGALRLPDWLPQDIEVRVVNRDTQIETIFIGGGRYRGLVIARNDWETSIDGGRLKEEMMQLREGRVGLVCYIENI